MFFCSTHTRLNLFLLGLSALQVLPNGKEFGDNGPISVGSGLIPVRVMFQPEETLLSFDDLLPLPHPFRTITEVILHAVDLCTKFI